MVTSLPVDLATFVKRHRSSTSALVVAVLLLRSRLIPRSIKSLEIARRRPDHDPGEALQQLYVEEPDGSKRLLVPYRHSIAEVRQMQIFRAVCDKFLQVRITPYRPEDFENDKIHYPSLPPDHRPNVDGSFLKQLRSILRILFPGWTSKQTGIIALHTAFLVLRTLLSVAVARLDGKIVRALVSFLPSHDLLRH